MSHVVTGRLFGARHSIRGIGSAQRKLPLRLVEASMQFEAAAKLATHPFSAR
jgi:hypothetical protein